MVESDARKKMSEDSVLANPRTFLFAAVPPPAAAQFKA
jgi:hypothetical protein